MNFKFIATFNDTDIRDLINYVLESNGLFKENRKDVNFINVTFTVDSTGNIFLFVKTAYERDSIIIDSFMINDYSMVSETNNINYDYEFRKFMTRKFGEAYIKNLHRYILMEADKEVKRLKKLL